MDTPSTTDTSWTFPTRSLLNQRLGMLAFLLSIVTVAAFVPQITNKTNALENPDYSQILSIASESQDFGVVWETDYFEWPVTIQNDSQHEISVGRFIASCSCTSITPQSVVVPARGTATVHARLDLSLSENVRGLDGRFMTKFQVDIDPVVGGCACHHDGWTITGTVRHALAGVPDKVTLDDYPIDEGSPPVSSMTFETEFRLC